MYRAGGPRIKLGVATAGTALSEPVENIAVVNLQLFSLLGEIPAKEG